MSSPTLSKLLIETQKRLPPAEAELLISHVLDTLTGRRWSRSDLFAEGQSLVDVPAREFLADLVRARLQGIPIQHLTGRQQFLSHEYLVSPFVLIPRPETEVVVDWLFHEIEKRGGRPQSGAEIGLGSGIISIEALSKYPELRMTASEISAEARAVAESNAMRILGDNGRRLTVVEPAGRLDVWSAFSNPSEFDFVVSNPPYVSRRDPIAADVLGFEPDVALFSPTPDPLFFYRELAAGLRPRLKADGFGVFEISEFRSKEIADLFMQEGFVVQVYPDLNERDRVLVASFEEMS